MSNINPTVGRKVWYFVSASQSEPWDATVIKVLNPEAGAHASVNLSVVDPDTGIHTLRGPVAWHDAAQKFPSEHFQWMPYQHAAAQKDADAANTKVQAPPSRPLPEAQTIGAADVGTVPASVAQAGFSTVGMLTAIAALCVSAVLCAPAHAKGNLAALAKAREAKVEKAEGKKGEPKGYEVPGKAEGYTVPSAGKWSAPAPSGK